MNLGTLEIQLLPVDDNPTQEQVANLYIKYDNVDIESFDARDGFVRFAYLKDNKLTVAGFNSKYVYNVWLITSLTEV